MSVETSEVPLTLGEEDSYSGGLVVSHLKYNLEYGSDVDELKGFVSVESAFYPELFGYYEAVLDQWLDEHRFQEEE